MKRLALLVAIAACLTLTLSRSAGAAGVSGTAPDFPPGLFSDGGRYKVGDFKDKVLVLFFYESQCPRCRGTIPDRNKVVEAYRGKPVKFLAISPHNTLAETRQYISGTHLAMPAFADPLGVM